jgi:hypothetical protein
MWHSAGPQLWFSLGRSGAWGHAPPQQVLPASMAPSAFQGYRRQSKACPTVPLPIAPTRLPRRRPFPLVVARVFSHIGSHPFSQCFFNPWRFARWSGPAIGDIDAPNGRRSLGVGKLAENVGNVSACRWTGPRLSETRAQGDATASQVLATGSQFAETRTRVVGTRSQGR